MNKGIVSVVLVVAFCRIEAAPTLFLGKQLHVVPGIERNVYFRSITDAFVPERYAWRARCMRGRQEKTRWSYTAKDCDVGKSFPLVVEMWDDENGLVAAATSSVHVIGFPADRTKKLTMALLGDSLTGCRFLDQTAKLMREFGFTGFKTIGKRKELIARHDGYGGFGWETFLTRYAFSMDEIDQVQSEAEREQLRKFGEKIPAGQDWRKHLLKSPLVRIVNGEKRVDIQSWVGDINGGVPPDVIVIELGTNDVFGEPEGDRVAWMKRNCEPGILKLLDSLHRILPKTMIAVMTIPPGADQDAFGVNYGCAQAEFVFRRNVIAYNRLLEKIVCESNNRRLCLVSAHAAVDPVYGYITRDVPAHDRTTVAVERCVNAVHFDETGARQYGDALFGWLVFLMGNGVE